MLQVRVLYIKDVYTHLLFYSEIKNKFFNPIALRMAKTIWSFGRSECNRIKKKSMQESVKCEGT